ncbi:hypothetical protein CFOLD11_08990 [Clostridium folliculivorans]|uniref:Uncharacterized protein n=1 Tax=Clostridium folliculivorans TaxID=2886038 RepID=A0A9W5XZX7_9CLOT|nr:hypothetical protein [Clostridium folliculivorans]GKU24073.1 hypothetical protein CFOLD11_08990 [Clostridium folliculivorans]
MCNHANIEQVVLRQSCVILAVVGNIRNVYLLILIGPEMNIPSLTVTNMFVIVLVQ